MSSSIATPGNAPTVDWTKQAIEWILSNVTKKHDNTSQLFQQFVDESNCRLPGITIRRSVSFKLWRWKESVLKQIGLNNTIHLLFVLGINVENNFRKRIENAGTVVFSEDTISYFKNNDGSIECKDGKVRRNRVNDHTDPGAQNNSTPSERRQSGSNNIRAPEAEEEQVRALPAQDLDFEMEHDGNPTDPAAQPHASGLPAREEQARALQEEDMEQEDVPERQNEPENQQNPEAQVEQKPIPFANNETENSFVQNVKQENEGEEVFHSSVVLNHLLSLIDTLDHVALLDIRAKIITELDRRPREYIGVSCSDFIVIVMGQITGMKYGLSDQLDPSIGMKLREFLLLIRIQLINLGLVARGHLILTIREIADNLAEKMIPMSRIVLFLESLFLIVSTNV